VEFDLASSEVDGTLLKQLYSGGARDAAKEKREAAFRSEFNCIS